MTCCCGARACLEAGNKHLLVILTTVNASPRGENRKLSWYFMGGTVLGGRTLIPTTSLSAHTTHSTT